MSIIKSENWIRHTVLTRRIDPRHPGSLIFEKMRLSGISNFPIFLLSWKYWKIDFLYFLISWKYWKLRSATFSITWKYGRRAGGGGRAAPGVVLCCLGLFLEHVSWNFRISWKYWKYVFSIFCVFFKKDARRNFTQDAPTDEPRSLI